MGASQRTVLFVEDDPDLQVFVKRSLSIKGIEVISATSAEQALHEYSKAQVVLSDLTLPDMEFEDFWLTFLSIDDCCKTPLIIASGRDDAAMQAEFYGAIALLRKPYALKDLWETVEAAFLTVEDPSLRTTG